MTISELKEELRRAINDHLAPYKAEMLRASVELKEFSEKSGESSLKERMTRRAESLAHYANKDPV